MSDATPKVVYDCNIFVQALINLAGPAARCVQKVKDGEGREAKGTPAPACEVN